MGCGIDRKPSESRIAAAFGGIDGEGPGEEQNAHDGEDRPALALLADHPAEHIGQRRADREDQHDLDEIGERVRVLVRMRRIGVEEAAAIGAHHFDDFLAGHLTLGDQLLATFECRYLSIGVQVLRHALPDEKESDHDRYRQKHVENGAGHIDPEIPDRLGGAAGKAPDERNRECDAGRGRNEIMHGEPGHLGQIAHRRLGHVGLPIGIGDEAHRRVEGEIGRDRVEMLRVERQNRLQALQGVKSEEARKAEGEHGEAIADPTLLLTLVDAAQRIEDALDRTQERRQERAFAVEDAGHIKAERLDQERDDHAIKRDLNETIGGHGMPFSETLGAYQGDDEVDHDDGDCDRAEDVLEYHG